ncbi:MAG: DUF3575 domain-containing protein [Prevotella sp.]|jgi:hypothetical protein|nr:DUF3575 domain-containing protein [Prevotella sp.]
MKLSALFIFSLMLLFIPVLNYAQGVSGMFSVSDKVITGPDTLRTIDKSILSNMVSFLQPKTESLKIRCSRSSTNIDYPVGKTNILTGYGNNAAELRKIDMLMRSILADSLITINTITITGYSSPDGSYAINEMLSRRRSEDFKKYLTASYPLKNIPVQTNWSAEDWDGFSRLVEASNDIAEKQKVLDIIRNSKIHPDAKDIELQQIVWWSENYKIILKELYPRLRRIELNIDYVVHPLNDDQAKELIYSRPEALSLEEMMRVSSFYESGSKQYREIYEIAAKHFPDDVVANNNAAAAVLLDGDTQTASLYLEKAETSNDNRILVNRGVISYIAGDTLKAREYFTEACHNGIVKGCGNLHLLNNSPKEKNKYFTEPDRTGNLTHNQQIKDGKSESYRFAVKTNLLYDIALLPNIAIEFPLGQHWSMEIEGQWSWWNTKITHNNCWRIQSVGLETRKWLGDKSLAPLTGHYLGIYGMAGTYDVKFQGKNGYLSDMSYSAGVSYGYSLPVSHRFSFEFGIAVGYFGGKYKVYDQYNSQNGIFPLTEKKNMHYFGPTKAKVSLVWIIGGGKN